MLRLDVPQKAHAVLLKLLRLRAANVAGAVHVLLFCSLVVAELREGVDDDTKENVEEDDVQEGEEEEVVAHARDEPFAAPRHVLHDVPDAAALSQAVHQNEGEAAAKRVTVWLPALLALAEAAGERREADNSEQVDHHHAEPHRQQQRAAVGGDRDNDVHQHRGLVDQGD